MTANEDVKVKEVPLPSPLLYACSMYSDKVVLLIFQWRIGRRLGLNQKLQVFSFVLGISEVIISLVAASAMSCFGLRFNLPAKESFLLVQRQSLFDWRWSPSEGTAVILPGKRNKPFLTCASCLPATSRFRWSFWFSSMFRLYINVSSFIAHEGSVDPLHGQIERPILLRLR